MNELALFAGAGGGILGGHLLGWRTVCAVEWEPYPASVLCARQNDGLLPPFPVWDDVQTFDGRPWRDLVDVVSGGFPCTDISAAGKGAGIEGKASGMWKHMARIVGEVLPRYVFVENSPLLVGRGLAVVLGDLAALGYDSQWACIAASDVGAPHQRDRVWLVADTAGDGREQWRSEPARGERRPAAVECGCALADAKIVLGDVRNDYAGISMENEPFSESGNGSRSAPISDADKIGPQRQRTADAQIGRQDSRRPAGLCDGAKPGWIAGGWPAEPDVGRVAHGVAARVDRLKAIGNGQVPRVAAAAWRILTNN